MTTAAIKIDSKIPMPKKTGVGRKPIYPFGDLEIGQSFWYEEKKVVRAASAYGIRNNKKFATTGENGGYRVWRIA